MQTNQQGQAKPKPTQPASSGEPKATLNLGAPSPKPLKPIAAPPAMSSAVADVTPHPPMPVAHVEPKTLGAIYHTWRLQALRTAYEGAQAAGVELDINDPNLNTQVERRFYDWFRGRAKSEWGWDDEHITQAYGHLADYGSMPREHLEYLDRELSSYVRVVRDFSNWSFMDPRMRQETLKDKPGLRRILDEKRIEAGYPAITDDEFEKMWEKPTSLGEAMGTSLRMHLAGVLFLSNAVKERAITGGFLRLRDDNQRLAEVDAARAKKGIPPMTPQEKQSWLHAYRSDSPWHDDEAITAKETDPLKHKLNAFLRETHGLPGYRNVGAKKLEDELGMHPLAAEVLTADIADPLAWLFGGTTWLALGAGAGGWRLLRAVQIARNARIPLKDWRTVMALTKGLPDELAEMAGVRPAPQPKHAVEDLKTVAKEAGEFEHTGRRVLLERTQTGRARRARTIEHVERKADVPQLEKAAAAAQRKLDALLDKYQGPGKHPIHIEDSLEARIAEQTKVVNAANAAVTGARQALRAQGELVPPMQAAVERLAARGYVEDTSKARLRYEAELRHILNESDEDVILGFLSVRADQITTQKEMVAFQRIWGKYLAKHPEVWRGYFNEGLLKRPYYNPKTTTYINLPAGMMQEYMDNPLRFIEVKQTPTGETVLAFRRNADGRALRNAVKASNWDDIESLHKLSTEFVDGGMNPHVRMFREGIETKWAQGEYELGAIGQSETSQMLRFKRNLLEHTGFFQPMMRSDGAMRTATEVDIVDFMAATGSTIMKYGDDGQVSLILGGPAQLKITGDNWLMTPMSTRIGRMIRSWVKPDPKYGRMTPWNLRESAEVMNLNDAVIFMMSKAHHEALATRRMEKGLRSIEEILASDPELAQRATKVAERLRAKFADLHARAVKYGFLTPERFLEHYLPVIRREMQGLTFEQKMQKVDQMMELAWKRGHVNELPFLARFRSGEFDPDVLNLAEMYEQYVRTLNWHIYKRPVLEDMERVLTSIRRRGAAAGHDVTLSEHELRMAEQFLQSQLGKSTEVQHVIFQNMTRSLQGIGTVLKELGLEDAANAFRGPEGRLRATRQAHRFSRVISDMFYLGFLGMRAGTAARNLTQKALALGFLGRGLEGGQMRAAKYMMAAEKASGDAVARGRFAASNRAHRWSENFAEFIARNFEDVDVNLIPADVRDFMMFAFRWSDIDNRQKVFFAAEAYVDELVDAFMQGGKTKDAYKEAAVRMRPSDQATFERLFQKGEFGEARRIFAEFLVNESQFIYHPLNRSEFTKLPYLGLSYMFMTWPLNYAEFLANGARAGGRAGRNAMRGKGAGQFTQAGAYLGGAMGGMADLVMQYWMLGVGMSVAGEPLGLDLGRWFFPTFDWSKVPGIGNEMEKQFLPLSQRKGNNPAWWLGPNSALATPWMNGLTPTVMQSVLEGQPPQPLFLMPFVDEVSQPYHKRQRFKKGWSLTEAVINAQGFPMKAKRR